MPETFGKKVIKEKRPKSPINAGHALGASHGQTHRKTELRTLSVIEMLRFQNEIYIERIGTGYSIACQISFYYFSIYGSSLKERKNHVLISILFFFLFLFFSFVSFFFLPVFLSYFLCFLFNFFLSFFLQQSGKTRKSL